MFKSIKFKLVLWYFIILTIILAAFSFFLYFSYRYSLYSRVDASLQSRAETVAGLIDIEKPDLILQFNVTGTGLNIDQIGINFPPASNLYPFIEQARIYGQFIQIIDSRGKVVAKSSNLGSREIYLNKDLFKIALGGHFFFQTLKLEENTSVRLLTYPVIWKDKVICIIQVGTLLNELQTSLEKLSLGLLVTVPTTLLLALLGGFVMAGKVLKPIEEINMTAKKITGENLTQRLEVKNPHDEIGSLQKTLNQMFDRLENAFSMQKRFTADASHELRTPLTVLKGEIEVALKKTRRPEEYRDILESNLEEVDRLTKIIKDLLFLARTDNGKDFLSIQNINLSHLCKETIKYMELLASEKKIHISTRIDEELIIQGDPDKIKQLLLNLLENGIKYNKENGKITLSLHKNERYAELKISDTGIGISSEDIPYIFERFYRVDKARSREMGGSGLGLSIVKWIVEVHQGEIEVESRPGEGSTFKVLLPINV
ncbi:MAG TPA: heavy metal sensor histidine kinase [Candidatus Eremiobacteraeota bacterium]|nr:MAG: Sensor kinase CusS [bacterium ADurb.Bin363]HPZ09445.1 heavy metal sensor histidine kinase [Candidatus Eremiobacteraeota bacterium]